MGGSHQEAPFPNQNSSLKGLLLLWPSGGWLEQSSFCSCYYL